MSSDSKLGVLLAMCVSTGFLGAQIAISSSPAATLGFVDLSATGGTALTVSDDSETLITTTIGNPLFPAGPVLIGTNGVLIAGALSGNVAVTNTPLAGVPYSTSAVPFTGTGYLFPFWDDLQPLAGSETTTVYWQESAGVLYVMWKDVGHFSHVAGQVITFEVQVFGNAPACGPCIQYVYADTVFGGSQGPLNNGASATIGYVGSGPLNSANLQWSFNVAAVGAGSCLSILDPAADLLPTSPFGAGSLKLQYGASTCAGPYASYILAATLHAGSWPAGWLFGVDIPVYELLNEISTGAPFVGSGGAFSILVTSGLPAVTIYAVVLGFDASGVLAGHSNPIAYTIP